MTSLPYNLISALTLVLASCNATPHEDRAAHATPNVAQAPQPAPAPEPAPVLAPPTPVPQEIAGPEVTPIFTVGEAPPRGTPTEYDQMVEALRAPMVELHEPMDMSADSIHGPHSIVYVPRRAAHSMHNTKSKPLIGYAVFTPAFDGKDRVPVAQP